ncbi:MAG: hypothetical protein VXZ39_02295 [Planctomycetota bacterium]|nr:hypothetical protein [Planctomycetota bacterium]MEC8493722.1 hypothetical protein [Planctomycetota bacterium]MEC8512272.1 hypothetical protein [Planctomycetota bacterium]
MSSEGQIGFFGNTKATEVLELLVDEVAGALSLLCPFQLSGPVTDDEVVEDRPGADESVRIAIRYGFKTPRGVRMGFLQLPLDSALTLAGNLLMLPTAELKESIGKEGPDDGEKEALMEVGELLATAFQVRLRKRLADETVVQFFGCQGVESDHAPWVANYGGEPLAVRRHLAGFEGFEPFELMVAIPA